ncbi:MAG: 5-oxoprolinase subunit PxpA [Agarilytica sp.]
MKLNCDLGEGLDEIDAALMPHIDMASIACGGHTGDKRSMARAIELALHHHVTIGAHPSYPDRENFGRSSITIDATQLFDSLCEQVQQLHTIATSLSASLHYIKPHGALYNDAWHQDTIHGTLLKVSEAFDLPLVMQANVGLGNNETRFKKSSIISEAFADRAYTDEGTLVSRKHNHATHDTIEKSVAQAKHIYFKNGLFTESGKWLPLCAETLCIHSDSPNAIDIAMAIKAAFASDDRDNDEQLS